MWSPDPSTVQPFVDSGTSDMGSVTDRGSKARFSLDEKFVLVYARVSFGDTSASSGASSSNTMEIRVDHHLRTPEVPAGSTMPQYAFKIDSFPLLGAGDATDLNYRILRGTFAGFTFSKGDILVFVWTNPNTNQEQRWDLEVGLAPAEDSDAG